MAEKMGFALECLATLLAGRKALSLHCDGPITMVVEGHAADERKHESYWGLWMNPAGGGVRGNWGIAGLPSLADRIAGFRLDFAVIGGRH
jgi:hypothetical protein